MSAPAPRFTPADERLHPHDPADWSWNESWFFSWIDLDGGPAGFFRAGLLPNQGRAMLWSFVHVDDAWFGIEESRLAFEHFDLADGLAYDRWALQFGWRPVPPLDGAQFDFDGVMLARTGPRAGAQVSVSLQLDCRATSACVGSGPTPDRSASPHPIDRFEQSLAATGTLVVDGRTHAVRAGAHRDHSWGPREWRIMFTLGDAQSADRQLYFVQAPAYGMGSGYLRDGSRELRHLTWIDGSVDFDDAARTITGGKLVFEDADGERVDVSITPIAPSVAFDMAHTCEQPEQWLYWRTLVEARVQGWNAPCRGWLEANRFGAG